MKTDEEKRALGERQQARGRFRAGGTFWLYFEGGEEGLAAVETSLVPEDERIARALMPLGFQRLENGGWRATYDAGDVLRAMRLAAAATAVLMEVGT